ncbi:MAG TPA: hypothetical protein VGS41_09735, partial [Chthonomonadales bacterium]|nr:hypothetical protein [Chthonomonadales bacterium]
PANRQRAILDRYEYGGTTLCLRMARTATRISLDEQVRSQLECSVRSTTAEQRLAFRARIILAAAEGTPTKTIAASPGVRIATVSPCRTQFAAHGITGLQEALRSGAPPVYDERTVERILNKLDEKPPSRNAT